jgi:CHAT domain-containing protein
VASSLAKSTELVLVVPDGSLHRVNVSALPSEKNGYLLENGPSVQILSTGRDVTRIQRTSWSGTEANGLLAVGNPDYDASPEARIARLDDAQPTTVYRGQRTDCAALREMRWADLPQSGHEVEQIAALFSDRGPVVVLVGADASEERFKREAPGKKVLHLATHGFFLQGDCASAENVGRGIALPTGGGTKAVASWMENPLLLSGLVFAGANRIGESSDEDGILTAEELAALDLRGTELVALSACDTGLGTVEVGEGVLGLRRALEIAGARTILMSLWPVPDEQARQWMTSFYNAKLGGRSVVEASREASLGILAELRERDVRPHPYLWAGFVAAGDWR